MQKVKFGVIGAGRIAEQFVSEAALSEKVEVAAITARNFEKTKAFAQEKNIPTTYETVEELLNDASIEAIYVATLHPTHYEFTIEALRHGKNVLCEKPATLTYDQMKHVQEVAKEEDKLFMEAMTIGHHPLYKEIKAAIANGEIGEVTHVESTFGSMSTKEHKHTVDLAGGCVYDIGIYNIFLIYDLLGPAVRLQTQKKMHRTWDVVGTVQLLAEHVTGAQSYSFMTMDALSTSSAAIIGTEGTIELGKGWTVMSEYTITKPDGTVVKRELENPRWLGYEMDHFADLIREGKKESDIMPLSKSMALQKIIKEIYIQEDLPLPAKLRQLV